MAFQDFDLVQERRRQERQRKFKKRVTIASIGIFILLVLVGAGIFAVVVSKKNEDKSSQKGKSSSNNSPPSKSDEATNSQPSPKPKEPEKPSPKPDPKPDEEESPAPPKTDEAKPPPTPAANEGNSPLAPKANEAPAPASPPSGEGNPAPAPDQGPPRIVNTAVKAMCNGTLYGNLCETILEEELKSNPDAASQPKIFVKSSFNATSRKLDDAFANISKMEFASDEEKQAFGVCKEVMEDAKEELQASMDKLAQGNLSRDGYMSSRLSAIMSYQETCIDAFPDGNLKKELELSFNSSKEYTSNSLAMIKELKAMMFSAMGPAAGPGPAMAPQRRLLQHNSPTVGKDGLPIWMNHMEKRVLKAELEKPKPNITVAKDGSGDFKTLKEALDKIPEKYEGRFVIFMKPGTYEENVNITKKMVNLTLYGEGSQKTIITGSKNFKDGVNTYLTATVAVMGEGFLGQSIGFHNTAGPEKHQAVALRVQADRSIFLNCRFEGYQDTLYVQAHRQYYRNCVITGTLDFIFGDAAAVFQSCLILVRKPMENQQNAVTAQGRIDPMQNTGIVLQNCKIQPEESLSAVKSKFKSYLGRPWKQYSRTIIMESTIDDLIDPAGWLAWNETFALDTLFYAEYNNEGPGSKKDGRVKWPGVKTITKEEARKFTVGPFLQGSWINRTAGAGAAVRYGLFKN